MRARILLVGLLVFAAGCGGPRYVPVSGKVTQDGKPLANATVVFEPISGEENPGVGSHGKTDKNGQFTLSLLTGEKGGALVGKHKVRITAYDGDDEIPSSGSDMKFRKSLVPDEYNFRTTLTFPVPAGGTTEANFDLPASSPK